MEDELGKRIKRVLIKSLKRVIKLAILPITIFIIIFAASTYFVTVDDGTYKDDDWSSVPFASGTYVNGTTVDSDGKITSSTTADELWKKMIQNGSRVKEYLKSPKELARLMRAEIVTQYPDTRPNPDEKINWEDIVEDSDTLQGIIKFKRAQSDGNKTTMTYVDPQTFQGYIDEYNKTGSEKAKQNALTHFTMKKASKSTTSGNNGAVAAGEGVMTDVSQSIVDATNNTAWPGANYCAQWVDDVYTNAGLSVNRQATAYAEAMTNVISTDKNAIPIGAAVYGTGQASGGAGHVGIYIGSGKVIDSISNGIKTWDSIDSWLSWQTDSIGGYQGWIGWGWADGNKTRGTTEDPNVTPNKDNSNNNKKDKDNSEKKNKKSEDQKAIVIKENGDGYTQKYTSSAGITYTEFKQYQGSYNGNLYWDGTINSSGCGPTSLAILMSGITNKNYTPADTADEMNSKYGLTSYTTLQNEMNDLGLSTEVIQNPSADQIQNNLKNGKVMLVSVNSNTIFTNIGHLMALIDINDQGEVYISNPASDTLSGWWNLSDILKGCDYIITTDAGAAGVANSSNTSGYSVVVATWKQVDTSVTTNDPNVKAYNKTEYTMTTTDINYQEMVEPYTMPFDLLWAFLVVGEDKRFAFELADLVYNSDIEITVHDNLTTNTDVDAWTYTQKEKAVVNANITANCGGVTASGKVENDEHESDTPYATTKTVVTQTDTITTALTRANVWIVDYENDYTYVAPSSSTSNSQVTVEDQEYPSSPNRTDNSYNCGHISAKKQELAQRVQQNYSSSASGGSSATSSASSATQASGNSATPNVTYKEDIDVKYYDKYVSMIDNITNTVESQSYISGTPTLKEKTDKDTAPNFVTIYNSRKHEKNRRNINSAATWLFEIIAKNDSTADMLDLIKYLLYKATGANYGVTEFDFSIFYPGQLMTVGSDDYVVDTTKSSSDIVIKDVETLKKAFSWYSNDRVLQQYANYFLECQNKYHVNAVFAAAVSITESSAGTNCAIGGNNIFSISNGGQGNWNSYGTMESSIDAFFKLISTEYFGKYQQYSVDSIARGNPAGTHMYCVPPDNWIKNTVNYMTEMFKTAGIDISSVSGGDFVQVAKKCHDFVRTHNFTYGGGQRNLPVTDKQSTIDCSGYVSWVLYEYGYKELSYQLNTGSLYSFAQRKGWKIKPGSQAEPGDILLNPASHTEIYIGNGKVYNCGSTSAIREESSNVSTSFQYAITVTKP